MKLSGLIFCRFSASKYFYFVYILYETFLPVNDKNYSWRWLGSLVGHIGDIEYFNTTLGEYKAIYPDGNIYFWLHHKKKNDFDDVQVIFL